MQKSAFSNNDIRGLGVLAFGENTQNKRLSPYPLMGWGIREWGLKLERLLLSFISILLYIINFSIRGMKNKPTKIPLCFLAFILFYQTCVPSNTFCIKEGPIPESSATTKTLLPLPDIPNLEGKDIVKLDPGKQSQRDLELSTPLFLLDDSQVQDKTSESILSAEDENNLKLLWVSVLRRNPTLQFALKQLNVSPSIRQHHKSIGARVLSGMLGGVGLIPYAFGTNPASISAATASTNVADRLNNIGGIDPRTLPSDAELVTLSSTVESVRNKVINNYFAYKSALESLEVLNIEKQALSRFSKNISTNTKWTEKLTYISEKQHLDESQLNMKQQAEMAFIQLERVCGAEALSTIRFGTVIDVNAVIQSQADTQEAPTPLETLPGELKTNGQQQ